MPTNAGHSDDRVEIWESAHLYTDEGRRSACLIDLSADGALIRTAPVLPPGTEIVVGVHLSPELTQRAGCDYLRLELSVVETANHGMCDTEMKFYYRCRHLAPSGSNAHLRAAAVVIAAFDLQRQQAA